MGRLALIDVDSKRVVVERLTQLRTGLLSAVPELPAYFSRVSDHCLTHEENAAPSGLRVNYFGRDEGKFRISSWGEYGGDADGHLIPEALFDGYSLTENEDTGLASIFPRVPLAEITLSRHVPALRWSDLKSAMGDLPEEYWLDVNAIAAQARARKLFPEVGGNARGETDPTALGATPISKSWRVHLVAFPCGGRAADDIKIGILVEDMVTSDIRLDMLGLTSSYDGLEILSSNIGMWNDKTSSFCALADISCVKSDINWTRMEEMVDSLWLATGDSAMRILRALEEENAKLKRLLADAMLDNVALKDLLGKKW